MTLTLNSTWQIADLHEAKEGRLIAKGLREDLRELNRIIIHEMASNAGGTVAVLSVPNRIDATIITTSYATFALGKIRAINGCRFRVHIYGDRVRARITVGGQVLSTASQTGTGDAWGSSGTSTLSSATADSDGLMTVLVEAQLTAVGGTGFLHIVLEERTMAVGNLPGATSPNFIATHDEAYATADDPVDAYAIQQLDDNEKWARFLRGRKHLHLYPGAGPRSRLASYTWRLDGPYTMQVPQTAEEINVSICLQAVNSLDFTFLALTEFEQLEEVIDARAQTVTSSDGAVHRNFLGLKCRPGQPCLVWVAFKSEIAGSNTTSVEVFGHSQSNPHALSCDRNATLEALSGNAMFGYCFIAKAEDLIPTTDPTIKASLGYSTPEQVCDLACMQGVGRTHGSDDSLMLSMSPSPATGITRAPNFSAVIVQTSGGVNQTSYTPEINVRALGLAYLYGVYVEATARQPARGRLARPGLPPGAGVVQLVAARVNGQVRNNTPAVITRHAGQRRQKPTASPGGGVLTYDGIYLFADSSVSGADIAPWQLPLTDPNYGVSSGLLVDKLYGQFIFMAAMSRGNGPAEASGLIEVGFTGATAQIGSYRLRDRATQGAQASPTESDALIASQSTSYTPGSSPTESRANQYTQMFTWPSEGEFRRQIWDLSPVFEMDIPGSFPTLAVASISPKGGNRVALENSMTIVVAGLHVWWGPRS